MRETQAPTLRNTPQRFPASLWEAAGAPHAVEAPLPIARRTRAHAATASPAHAQLIVLASSSAGNASLLITGHGKLRRATLIDAGLSPRRTFRALAALSLAPEHLDRILFTHLDRDHAHNGWIRALPRHAEFIIHRRHRARAERMGLLVRRTRIFDDQPFDLTDHIEAHPTLAAHDDLGVVAFRFNLPPSSTADQPSRPRSLGYATDLGRVTDQLIHALSAVDVLAIESNYCPRMQIDSDRPEFLKRRIMDGAGHLSNEQCATAVQAIAPARAVVLLHLSRQCNTPERAAEHHAAAPYELAIAHWANPIPAITL
ncbi:MAG: MBL fold metallo-hydrolase [Phycisphaerales bacterium]